MSGHRRWVCRSCGHGIGGHADDCKTGRLARAVNRLRASDSHQEVLRRLAEHDGGEEPPDAGETR